MARARGPGSRGKPGRPTQRRKTSGADSQKAKQKANPWAGAGRSKSSRSAPRRTEAPPAAPGASVKLQKFLADAGFGSRRQLEGWISAGRIEVNGEPATLGDRVTGAERIVVDGKPLNPRGRSARRYPRILLLNKAEGVICTRRDPEGRKTVFTDLPVLKQGRWISIGRLDIATTGLLLLTNDGELAHRMMHPSTGLDREYAVRTDVVLEDEQLEQLKAGVDCDGERLRFADIRYFDGRGANHWYHVVLLEGRNHEVRRLFASAGAEVRRLKRVRYGPVLLPSWLRRGQRFELNNADVSALYALLGMRADLPAERRSTHKSDRRDFSVLIPYPEVTAARPTSGALARRFPDAVSVSETPCNCLHSGARYRAIRSRTMRHRA